MDESKEPKKGEPEEAPPPPSIFKDSKLLTKEHFNMEKYVPDRANYGLVDGEEATRDVITAVYFAAAWCPPCQQFTPILRQVARDLSERHAPFRIVFVSFDRSKEAMEEFYVDHHGDWLAVRYDDPLKEELSERFNISAIPKLIVLRPDGEVITVRGRKDVQDKGVICFRSWLNATSLTNMVTMTRPISTSVSRGEGSQTQQSL